MTSLESTIAINEHKKALVFAPKWREKKHILSTLLVMIDVSLSQKNTRLLTTFVLFLFPFHFAIVRYVGKQY